MNILEIIKRVSSKEDLNFKESAFCMNEIMSGKLLPSQFGAIMASLAIKGETAEEIAGMASVMRDFSVKIKGKENAIDVCGTGGSGLKWFNISTASAILVASCGVPVAKHGNRAASGNSGSADVLEELGINILIQPEKVENCLNEINFTFIFAQSFHPSMKFAAPYRKEIGIRTIFNFLGPLTNPASVKKQIIGTPNKEFAISEFTSLMEKCGVETKQVTSPVTLELSKIICDTSYYGWLINYAQISKIVSDRYNVDYDEMWSFADEIHKILGNRPKMFPGYIGGHCVIPNLELMDDESLSQINTINEVFKKFLDTK